MDISKKSIVELKAIGYDIVAQLENMKKSLEIVNREIAKRVKEVSPNKEAEESVVPKE